MKKSFFVILLLCIVILSSCTQVQVMDGKYYTFTVHENNIWNGDCEETVVVTALYEQSIQRQIEYGLNPFFKFGECH